MTPMAFLLETARGLKLDSPFATAISIDTGNFVSFAVDKKHSRKGNPPLTGMGRAIMF
jgi:hypothetical protein